MPKIIRDIYNEGKNEPIIIGAPNKRKKSNKIIIEEIKTIELQTFEPKRKTEKFHNLAWMGALGIMIILLINALNSYGRGINIASNVAKSSVGIYQNLTSASEKISQSDLDSARNLLSKAAEESEEINKQLWFLDSPLSSAQYLTNAANNFIEITEIIKNIGIDFVDKNAEAIASTPINDQISRLEKAYKDFTENINKAEKSLSSVNMAVAPENIKQKIESLNSNINKIKKLLPDTNSFIKGLSSLLSANKKQNILILLQNDSESRPTGGFIGSVLFTEIENGKIKITFQDVYDIDRNFKEIIEPPEEIKNLTSRWFFRDSNYSPDFPASAKKAIWFYEKETGVKINTIIAVNQSILKKLLEITGEISVPGLSRPLNAENYQAVLSYLIEYKLGYKETGVYQPKKILKEFIDVFKNQIFKIKDQKKLLAVLLREITLNNILGYSDNPDIQSLFEFIGMDGKMLKTAENEDYLNITAVSIGGNKTDAYIKQNITHASFIYSNGEIENELTLERAHTFDRNTENKIKQILNDFGYKEIPDFILEIFGRGRNKIMLKVYIPKNSTLISSSGKIKNIQTLFDKDTDKTYFSFIMDTHPGQTTKAVLRYKLPFRLSYSPTDVYRLTAQKQPGMMISEFTKKITAEEPLKILISYPKTEIQNLLSCTMFSALIVKR